MKREIRKSQRLPRPKGGWRSACRSGGGENIYQDGDFTYTTYIYKTSPDELESFEPTLNSEHTDYMLHTIGDDTSGIHPGVIEVINGLKKEAYTIKSIYEIIKNNAK